MASSADVQYVAYLKAKFNLVDADLLQVITLASRPSPAPGPRLVEESGSSSDEVVETSMDESYEEVLEESEEGYDEVVDEYMDESVEEVEEVSDEEVAGAPTPAPMPLQTLAPAPAPAPAILATSRMQDIDDDDEEPIEEEPYDEEPIEGGQIVEAANKENQLWDAQKNNQELVLVEDAPEDEIDGDPTVMMPETVELEPKHRKPASFTQSIVKVEEELEEENELAAIEAATTQAIVPATSQEIVPAPSQAIVPYDEEAAEKDKMGTEPPIQEPQEEKKEESNPILLVIVAFCLFLLIVIGILLILIFVTGTIPKWWEDDEPPAMGPYQPGNCNFEGQAQPNVISQCECTDRVSQVSNSVQSRYEQLSVEFLVPTVYDSWTMSIGSCEPENLALLWLSTGPKIEDQNELLQRYVMAFLYYSTTGQEWNTQTNWMTNQATCAWYGLSCAGTNVNSVELIGNALNGPLPSEFGTLTQLQTITLDGNTLQESVPGEIFQIPALTKLSLGTNSLVGAIPTGVGRALSLTSLTLENNLFVGDVPTELNQLTRLSTLSLAGNKMLTGRIATEYGLFTSLQTLSLSDTDIRARIPTQYAALTRLQELRIANTLVGGDIPSGFEKLTSLSIIDFSGSRFRKSIPTFMGQLTGLTALNLTGNELEGEIPSELGRLTRLTFLDLSNNLLSGLLPPQIGQLTALESFHLEGNSQLTGNAPSEVCALRTFQLLNFTSDCPGRSSGILCPIDSCCTSCMETTEADLGEPGQANRRM